MSQASFRIVASIVAMWCVCGPLASAAQPQPAIEPAKDGTFTLTAKAAKIDGKSVRYVDESDSLEHWSGRKDHGHWTVNSPKMGNFDVAVTWSVAEEDAPQGYNIEIDHRPTIRAFTVSTDGKFKREIVGRIMMAHGV